MSSVFGTAADEARRVSSLATAPPPPNTTMRLFPAVDEAVDVVELKDGRVGREGRGREWEERSRAVVAAASLCNTPIEDGGMSMEVLPVAVAVSL